MAGGFYLMHRGWMDSDVFQSVRREPLCHRAAWCWLIDHALFAPITQRFNGRDHALGRGQMVTSLLHLGVEWGWTTSKVARALSALQSAKMIDTASDKRCTVITICNYDKYQAPEYTGDIPLDVSPTQTPEIDRYGKEIIINNSTQVSNETFVEDTAPRLLAEAMAAIWIEECGDVLGKPQKLSAARIKQCSARMKTDLSGDLEQWRKVCRRIRSSTFLTTQWLAKFDWVLEQRNILKIMEGNYDNRPGTNVRPGGAAGGNGGARSNGYRQGPPSFVEGVRSAFPELE